MRRTAFTAIAVIAPLALALTACGQDTPKQPPVSAFAEGTCRLAAPDVLALGDAGRRLGGGK
jgi:hypothetical protein